MNPDLSHYTQETIDLIEAKLTEINSSILAIHQAFSFLKRLTAPSPNAAGAPLNSEHTVQQVTERAAAVYGVMPLDLLRKRGTANVCDARDAAMWICCTQTNLSHEIIALFFKRTRSAIHHALKRVRERREVDPRYRAKSDQLLAIINSHKAAA
jgi:chromosomal replication initiation ATPase DnaA